MSEAVLSRQPVLATEDIRPGHHPTFQFVGLTFNTDTLISTGVAGVTVLGAGLYMARRASAGRPSKLQLLFEMLVEWVHGQVVEQMGVRAPRGVVQLCVTTFAFIHLLQRGSRRQRGNPSLSRPGYRLSD